ncbi:hypothetical protein [Cellulomonas chitinilytica]|nr:hypothetical protein [Cellulomonas chitinilytica]
MIPPSPSLTVPHHCRPHDAAVHPGQDQFLAEAAGPLLEKLRAAAPSD